MKYVLFV